MSEESLCIFDTTLRDGEQSPGINLHQNEKIEIAEMLESLRVDVIEAGFASASQGDFNSIKAIAEQVKDSTVCSLCRATDKEIDMTAEALKPAISGRIHIVLSTSDLHMRHKLKMSPADVIELGVRAVKRARQYSNNVEFSCEDASRSDIDFLSKFVESVISAGATTVSLPDTVGYALPSDYASMISTLRSNVVNSDKVVFSAHCHNDLGLAVANSLAAIEAGARQVECTINGLGERAGNASLEEIVMAIKTRKDRFSVNTRIRTNRLLATSQLVSDITGFIVPPNKAIVGKNAFLHESGIHQDGMLKDRNTYQIMDGADVGWTGSNMVMGKHSGRNGFQNYMKLLGVEFNTKDQLNSAFNKFKHLTDSYSCVSDEQLISICRD
jgi:2-isopropylmalate synthase